MTDKEKIDLIFKLIKCIPTFKESSDNAIFLCYENLDSTAILTIKDIEAARITLSDSDFALWAAHMEAFEAINYDPEDIDSILDILSESSPPSYRFSPSDGVIIE